MPFNVSNFKSQATNWLRPYSYEVTIQPPTGSSGDSREIRLRTESVTLPGGAFLSFDNYKPYGSGLVLNIPYGVNTQEITCIHTVDSNAEMLQRFYDWMNLIGDLSGERKFTPAYLNEYASQSMSIKLFDLKGQKIKEYELIDAFPMTMSQTQMSWGTGNEVTKIDVNYRFRNYILK